MTKKESEFYYQGKYEGSLDIIKAKDNYIKILIYIISFACSLFLLIVIISAILAFYSPDQKTEVRNENTQTLKATN